jgi:hypothetical protein
MAFSNIFLDSTVTLEPTRSYTFPAQDEGGFHAPDTRSEPFHAGYLCPAIKGFLLEMKLVRILKQDWTL